MAKFVTYDNFITMDRSQAEKRIIELRKILWENSRKYYVDNAPVISDYEYDHLMYELADLEKQFRSSSRPIPLPER